MTFGAVLFKSDVMKKYLTVLLSLIMALQCVIFVNAVVYDKDSRYTIDLPEKFQSVGENKFLADDKSNFYVIKKLALY